VPAADAPEGLYKLVGERLARLRIDRGATQGDLGTFAGLTRASIANIEKGRQRVLVHQLYLFADFLDTDVEELLPEPQEVKYLGLLPEAETAYLQKVRDHFAPPVVRSRGRSRKHEGQNP